MAWGGIRGVTVRAASVGVINCNIRRREAGSNGRLPRGGVKNNETCSVRRPECVYSCVSGES